MFEFFTGPLGSLRTDVKLCGHLRRLNPKILILNEALIQSSFLRHGTTTPIHVEDTLKHITKGHQHNPLPYDGNVFEGESNLMSSFEATSTSKA